MHAPSCTTKVPQVHLHGSEEVSSLITNPRDPGDPPPKYNLYSKGKRSRQSFMSVHTFHTHRTVEIYFPNGDPSPICAVGAILCCKEPA